MLLFALCMFFYFLTVGSLYPLFLLWPSFIRKWLCRIVGFYCAIAGRGIFGIDVQLSYEVPLDSTENFLIVSNHLGYLDIIVLAPYFPSCFVTSQEMRKTPLLGQVCQLAGCLFVDRRSKKNLHAEIDQLSKALTEGHNILIFPESTSTNGEHLLPFKRPLFNASVNSGKRILPLCLNYISIDGAEINTKNRDKIFWYGEMGFLPHLWNFLKCRKMIVKVHILAPLSPIGAHSELAAKSFETVAQNFRPITAISQESAASN